MDRPAPVSRGARLTAFLTAAVLAAGIGACSREPPLPANTLVIAIEGNPTNLDPRQGTDAYSERIGHLLFNSLVRANDRGEIVPELALLWDHPDSLTYVFHLKPDVRFHDGTSLTSRDVRFTFESILDPESASPLRSNYENIRAIATPDPLTVIFRLREPQASFLANLIRGIVPANAAREAGKPFASHPVGSGPFRLVRMGDEAIDLEAFPACAFGAPALSGIRVRIIPDDTVRILELKKGNIHWIQNAVPLDLIPFLAKDPHLRIEVSPGTTYAYLGMNLTDPILKDRRVREAIARSIDRERIIREILNGTARPATGVLSPFHWAYEGRVSAYPYDPPRARALLDAAGYLPGRDRDGASRFTLLFKTSQNETARRVAEVIQQELSEVGIQMDIRSYEWGTFYADIKSGNFQLYTLNWVGITDPDIYYDIFYSKNIPPAGVNRNRYDNPALDRLLLAARRENDRTRRKAIYGEVQKIVARDLPYISLWTLDNVVVMRDNVVGYRPSPSGEWTRLKDVRLEEPIEPSHRRDARLQSGTSKHHPGNRAHRLSSRSVSPGGPARRRHTGDPSTVGNLDRDPCLAGVSLGGVAHGERPGYRPAALRRDADIPL